jgi:signal transduction histidine kinase
LAGSAAPRPGSGDSEGYRLPQLVELVPVAELQRIQDAFASATGVASVMAAPDGRWLTRPSRCTRLCCELVRPSPIGGEACVRSEGALCTGDGRAPIVRRCLAAGLWDGGAGIFVGRHRVANWLVGQVRDENESVDSLLAYGAVLGIDEAVYRDALAEVPSMSVERFRHVCDLLLIAANQVSQVAWANLALGESACTPSLAERPLDAQLSRSQKLHAVGQLAGGIAHDFNNLLTVILGNTALVSNDAWDRLGPGEQNLLREIEAAGNRAASLTRQLLAFSRRQPVAPAVVDVCAVLRSFEPMLSRALAASVEVDLRLAAAPVEVLIDRGQLEQAVLSLAINAEDAMPSGGRLEISVERIDANDVPGSLAPGAYARLRVRDEGVGIPPEHMERIFEPFFTTKEPGTGVGLGLATVFGIVEQASGKVLVRSAPGQGATFDVYLPLSGGGVESGAVRSRS